MTPPNGHVLHGELLNQLSDTLKDCSRQRLRALQMTLRSVATMDHCVSNKDLLQAFQVRLFDHIPMSLVGMHFVRYTYEAYF